MPAQTKIQVYAFESNFEVATRTILEGRGLYATLIQGANVSLPESRLEIIFTLGETLNQATMPNGEHVYDFFNAKLSLKIVTARPSDSPSFIPGVTTLHEEWAAGVRVALEERAKPFNLQNLPYYNVQTIRSSGSKRDLDPRWLEDFTTLDYLIEFGIRSDAWPL